ncbi:MAG TPA: D-aminoacyl-tRNA deacylase [Dissulfurispiraceae bacterium]|nr:D-aminoacyl-tRNA deacylase [Dissulfurispiraceae bacterium]
MKIVLQRVTKARVTIDDNEVSSIGKGLLLLVGIHKDDTTENIDFLASKCVDLRVFPDDLGKMNLSVRDIRGEVLAVSQFTLLGDCRKGRRPNFANSAASEKGSHLYERFITQLGAFGLTVKTGIFGAMMHVELVNDGPVTLILEK